MKRPQSLGIIILLLFFSNLSYYASHVPGGNITYTCLGNNQFRVILTLYEDCENDFISNMTESISAISDCGDNIPMILNRTVFQQEISQLCPSSLGQSECNGGGLPGVYLHQWEGLITLPQGCNSWRFEFSDCCRNASSNLTGIGNSYYFYALLNNLDAPCNSSPTITAPPIPYYCVNQPVCYNLGIVEPDGDSLVFSLVNALVNNTTSVPYLGGFSGAQPINGISIDPSSGLVNFTPTTQGNYVVVIQVDEYANGVLIGRIVQDFTFEVANCNNQIISCSNSNISNIQGLVSQINPTTLSMCEGESFSFDITFTDPDLGDSISAWSNIDVVLPGSIVTYNYPNLPNTNVITMSVSWTPPPGSSNSNNNFTVTIRDDACPVSGQQTLVYNIEVIGNTYAGLDLTICQGDSVSINAENGTIFNWYGISGDPIQVGVNFSCDTCASAIVSPNVTSVYRVVSNLMGACLNIDTIQINVAPNFTYSMSQSSTSSCLASEIQLNVIPNTPDTYTYNWSPNENINFSNIANPILTPTIPGTFQYAVEVINSLGCIKNDTIEIDVVSEYEPDLSLSTINLPILDCQDSAIFEIHLGGGIPSQCGPSPNPICSGGTTQQLGTSSGQNTNTGFPAPFGDWYKNSKHQFLYQASELQAMGFSGGKIDQIAFQVTSMNSSISLYKSYSVRMGCSGNSSLSTWETGLTQVFGPQDVNISPGWVELQFSTAYEWDGVSNLVIEVCYNNTSNPSWSGNASVPYSLTPFNSSIYFIDDITLACPYNGSVVSSTRRPITRFSFCPTTPEPLAFSFSWNVPTVTQYGSPLRFYDTPNTTTDYQLIVTNIVGGCADTINFNVAVECLEIIPTINPPTCKGYSNGSISVKGNGDNGPPWNIQLLDSSAVLIASVPIVMDSTIFTNLVAGEYIIRITDTVGLQKDSTIIIGAPLPVSLISVSNDTTICIGGTANLFTSATGGNGINYSYQWNPEITDTTSNITVMPTSNTNYEVYALDSLGCASDTLTTNVDLFPPITTITEQIDSVCQGYVANIEASASGGNGEGFFYDWYDEFNNSLGMGDSIDVTPTVSPSTYYVHVTDNCGTPMKIDSVIVGWYLDPDANFQVDIDSGCYPLFVNFENLTTASLIESLVWDFGDGETDTTNSNPIHEYTTLGLHDVSLSIVSPHGCEGDTTIINLIETFDYPEAQFYATPNPANIFQSSVQFTNESSSDATNFSWSFSDSTLLGVSSEENPAFTFSSQIPGTYPVELVVTNENGCADTTLVNVIVSGVYSFYVPTAFSPNGDDLNDIFLPKGDGLETSGFSMRIFDRNGRLVYSTFDIEKGWDGTTFKGEKVNSGVYIWNIEARDQFYHKEHKYFGYVTIIK